MAYSVPLPKHQCPCGKKANKEVFNHKNGSHGYRCEMCALVLVKELKKLEAEGYKYGL